MSGNPDPSVDTTEDTSSEVAQGWGVPKRFVLEFSRVTPDTDAL